MLLLWQPMPMPWLAHWSSESSQLLLAQLPGSLMLEPQLQVPWKALVAPLTALLLRQQDQLELQRQMQVPKLGLRAPLRCTSPAWARGPERFPSH